MFNNINTRSITFNLIVINLLFFVATLMQPQLLNLLSLHYLFNTHHFMGDPIGFQPYQIITHMFMHGGWMHILFNMWGLFMFGSVLEQVWGPRRFLIFYIITGLGAVLLHMLVQLLIVQHTTGSLDPTLTMLMSNTKVMGVYFSQAFGASGAIMGTAAGFATLFPNSELMIIPIPVPIKAKYLIPLYLVAELFMGVRGGDDVAHFAHLGGALFGFILVKLWNRNRNSLY